MRRPGKHCGRWAILNRLFLAEGNYARHKIGFRVLRAEAKKAKLGARGIGSEGQQAGIFAQSRGWALSLW